MERTIFSVVSLAVGSLLIGYYKVFARFTNTQQKKFWGINFSQRDVKFTEVFSIITGIGFISFGLLSLLQIIRFK